MNMKYILGGLAAAALVIAGAWFGGGLFAPKPSKQTATQAPAAEPTAPAQPAAPPETPSETSAASDPTPAAEPDEGETAEASPDPAKAPPGGATRVIGWMHGNCAVIADEELKPGTDLTIVALDDPQTVRSGTIKGFAVKDEDCTLLDGTRKATNADQGTAYVVDTIATLEFAAAIVHPDGAEKAPNPMMLDADEDGVLDTFNRCLSKDGVRFSVWNAEPFNSKELWRGSYKLEGERVPTCPPE